jgi:hypothetical protein
VGFLNDIGGNKRIRGHGFEFPLFHPQKTVPLFRYFQQSRDLIIQHSVNLTAYYFMILAPPVLWLRRVFYVTVRYAALLWPAQTDTFRGCIRRDTSGQPVSREIFAIGSDRENP